MLTRSDLVSKVATCLASLNKTPLLTADVNNAKSVLSSMNTSLTTMNMVLFQLQASEIEELADEQPPEEEEPPPE